MGLMSEQKLERRERILESARELIGELGYSGITMRELARKCRVSVPTLYNLFGGKDELLAAAVESHFRGLLDRVPGESADEGHVRMLAIVEHCGGEMIRLSAYHRSLLEAFADAGDTGALQLSLASELAEALSDALELMQRERRLAAWVDARLLAGQITAASISAAVIWARGGMADASLCASMVYAACMMVLGAARGRASSELERRARSAQATLAADPAWTRSQAHEVDAASG